MSSAWPALAQGISALAKGDGTILLLLADLYLDRRADGSYGNAIEAFDVISCVDEQRTTDPAAIADGARPASWPPRPTATAGRGVVAARDKCAFWPVPPTSTPHTPARRGPAADGGGLDDGRPGHALRGGRRPRQGARAARCCASRASSTARCWPGSSCVDDAVSAYLVDLTVPASRTACRLAP